jgi:membrane protease YdiL (CAAX protease family)
LDSSFPAPMSNRKLAIAAWVVTILVSTVPDIGFDKLAGGIPSWLTYAKAGLLLALCLIACFWKPFRQMRHFFFAMFAFFGLMELRVRLNFSWPALQAVFGNNVFDQRMQAEQTGKLAVSFGMIVTLLAMGYRRREFFLTRGNLGAPITPVPLLGFPKPDPWYRFGLQWSIYIAAALTLFQYFSIRPSSNVWLRVVPVLPSILFYAALNALNEEITFRSPMLATLEPAVGSMQALWISAFFFGIAHYFGTPGGIVGGILSIFMGWILGKGMLETRGLFWTWWIHFLSDISIFTFLTVALVS